MFIDRIQLSVYNTNTEGDVFSVLANYSQPEYDPTHPYDPNNPSTIKSPDTAGSDIIVVGAFDTTFQTSQVTYCSGKHAIMNHVGVFIVVIF